MEKVLSKFRVGWQNAAQASLGIVMVICFEGQALSQPRNPPLERSPLRFEQPDLPDLGAPIGRRRGGTSRNDCPALATPLTALVPGDDAGEVPDSQSYLATTISARPTFWVYIPPISTRPSVGEFILQDEAGNDLYRTDLTLPGSSGIVGISLPPSAPPLETSRTYHWYFKLYCGDPESQPEYFFVDAWIERVASVPDLHQPEQELTYLDYAAHDLWYDTLTALAKRRSRASQTPQIEQDWITLLHSVGLQDLAPAEIIATP